MTRSSPSRSGAFTLVELLAAMAVLAMLMTIIFGIFNQASKAWTLAENRTENFQSARAALDTMSRDLESAIVGTHTNSNGSVTKITIMTFEDSGSANGSALPFSTLYSGLSATSPNDAIFFITQSPDSQASGTHIDLAECGYFVAFSTSTSGSGGVPIGYYALMRHYARTTPSTSAWDVFSNPNGWWATGGLGGADQSIRTPLLDNVIRFEVRYEYANPNPGVTNGTSIAENWNFFTQGPNASVVPDPTIQLPRAFHLRLSVLDRRYATRVSTLLNGGPLGGELSKVPYNLDNVSPAAVSRTLKEGMRTFYRTVYPRNAQ